jgi:exodeoxyribonuclease V gamma subunit
LDRLLLGYALPEADSLFLDILPCDQIEGATAQLLAKFLDFFSKLTSRSRQAAQPKGAEDWAVFLRQLLADFFEESALAGAGVREKHLILQAIELFPRQTETARFKQKISFEIVQKVLQKEFASSSLHSEFIGGRVTFCQMVPMRSIPFKVICLLGLNDAAFPRQDRTLGFDLMSGNFRVGDRCRRDDDRYIFLETLLSARQVFYISYVGQGVQNGEVFPPSVVVSELLAAISPYLGATQQDPAKFTTVHPLQPFSPRYFLGQPQLRNFSETYRQAAGSLNNDTPYTGLFSKRLAPSDKLEVSIEDFLAFFQHPARYLLRQRLGLNLDDRYAELQDRERLSLDNLGRYNLQSLLLDCRLAGAVAEAEAETRKMQEKGAIPFGRMGLYDWTEAAGEVDNFLRPFLPRLAEPPLAPISLDLDLVGVRLTGRLENLRPSGQYLLRPTSVKALSYRDSVRFWILHLLLNAAECEAERTTCFIGKDGQEAYGPYEDALDELNLLATLMLEGMQTPLPLLPRSSFAYAQKRWNGKNGVISSENETNAVFAAESLWFEGDYFNGPEKDDPYLWAAFGEQDPFTWTANSSFSFTNCAQILLKRAFESRTGNNAKVGG